MSSPESPHGPSTGAAPETPAQKIAHLEEENARLREENAWLRQQNTRLEEQVSRLVERVEELERRLGLNSGNSGKPPSSDGLKKPKSKRRTRSLRRKSGRKPGGQPGHKGETLRRTDHPDQVKDHVPSSCKAQFVNRRLGLAIAALRHALGDGWSPSSMRWNHLR